VDLAPGHRLLHYRLVERLGEGGMGVVWKAVDTALDREVAIKLLPAGLARDPERLARFEREAKLLASLSHPNIAAVYGLHEDGGVRFLAMELVSGTSLTDEIARGISPRRTVDLATQIAEGLAAAHRQHVIHRDLKPDNILIDRDGRPKILDFGLAKHGGALRPDDSTMVQEAMTTRAGSLLGTVAYMSPEQAQGKPVDARSDVFSLGIVLYEMATGRRPFGGDNSVSILSSILRDTPAPLASLAPAAPPPLGTIVGRCLEKSADRRYPDASGVGRDLRALQSDLVSSPGRVVAAPRKRGWIAAAAIAVLLLGALAALWYRNSSRERWVRNEALPRLDGIVDRIQALEEGRESWDAFVLARKIDEVAPGDPLVEKLRPRFTREITITSDPPGALVTARYYDEPDAAPVPIGTTPLTKVKYPRGFTRVRLEIPGKPPVDDVIWNFGIAGSSWTYVLDPPVPVPKDMAFIPAGAFELYMPGLDDLKPEPTTAFLMDRHEATNRDYKRFVDAGGYADRKHWKEPFLEGGKEIPFETATARFVDRTGRPGPSTWEVGTYPDGHDDYPVAGVSWYEAAAYAAWAGKSLPTIFHWNRVAFTVASSRIVPASNLAGQGPVAVGGTKSMNRYGVADLAGNVREWTWNASDRGAGRFILGGGWNDPDYAFNDAYAQSPFDRSQTNGFRCIRYLERDPNLAALQRSVDRPVRDFFQEKPVSDEVFAQYLRQFAYDKGPLDARIEEEKATPSGVRQKITFHAAYGGERMMAYLWLPSGGKPPYQVVVVFPGSGSIDQRSSQNLELGRLDFAPRSGRAVLWPIYKGTYERGGALTSDYASETTGYKDYVIQWEKDLARSIDYVETRPDLDAGKIAYYGLSWGGAMGGLMPAVEKRIKVNILYVAGMSFQRALPEADVLNYVTRVRQPTLLLNGEYDFFFPPETSQRPMFELLGTPAADKKRLVYPGGHSVPRTEQIKESLVWLDRYLGKVGT
jgi:dienelactone hydrolase